MVLCKEPSPAFPVPVGCFIPLKGSSMQWAHTEYATVLPNSIAIRRWDQKDRQQRYAHKYATFPALLLHPISLSPAFNSPLSAFEHLFLLARIYVCFHEMAPTTRRTVADENAQPPVLPVEVDSSPFSSSSGPSGLAPVQFSQTCFPIRR